jgi:hypothetical protein
VPHGPPVPEAASFNLNGTRRSWCAVQPRASSPVTRSTARDAPRTPHAGTRRSRREPSSPSPSCRSTASSAPSPREPASQRARRPSCHPTAASAR